MDSKKSYIIILIIASLVTRFIFFGYPAETVFDEVHFGKFISGYFTGQYYYDIHPPLGKLMVAGVAKLANFHPSFSFESIGQKFPNQTYKWLRFLPKLFGAFLPLIVFWLALELGISLKFSFLAGLLTVLDNALIIQSRLILLDSFLFVFGFSALIFYLKFLKSGKARYILLTGILGALAGSIKWTGFSFLGLAALGSFFKNTGNRQALPPHPISHSCLGQLKNLRFWLIGRGEAFKPLKSLMFLAVIPFVVYFSIFYAHFKLLPLSGPGDAYHSQKFQKTLVGSKFYNDPGVKSINVFEKFVQLNKAMFSGNAGLSATHPYGSKWYQWPFMTRPIYYWNGGESSKARIYLLGNPLIWWASTAAVIFILLEFFNALYSRLRQRTFELKNFGTSLELLLSGYLLNLLPFVAIKRVMFLYHYLPALIFSILILVYILDKSGSFKVLKIDFYKVLLIASIVLFLVFSPLTYGFPLGDRIYNSLVWFSGWR